MKKNLQMTPGSGERNGFCSFLYYIASSALSFQMPSAHAAGEGEKREGKNAGSRAAHRQMRKTVTAALLVFSFLLLSACGTERVTAASAEEELTRIVDQIHSTDEADLAFAFDEGAKVLRVAFPRIKECDACLVTDGQHSILIDCATEEMAPSVLEMLRHQGITELDSVYITHPHPDHGGGLAVIAAEVPVGEVWTCFDDTVTATASAMKETCSTLGIPLRKYRHGHTFSVGEAEFRTYALEDPSYVMNNRSAAFRMQYGKAVMFFAADLERLGLRWVGNTVNYKELRMDILKYPHHGKDPLVREFWRPAQLRFTVVTSDSTTKRDGKVDIKNKRWPAAFTWDGEILLETDSETWRISQTPYTPQ